MIFTINKAEYKNLLSNTINLYSSSLKKAIVRRLKEDEKVTLNKNKVKRGYKYPILCDSNDEVIKTTIDDDDFFNFYENWDFEKFYKYSVPLTFEINWNSDITFDEYVSTLISDRRVIPFSENEKFDIPDKITDDLKSCIPYYKKEGNYALFKFLIKENMLTADDKLVGIRYPIIISINIEKGFLEIRFDGGKFEYKNQSEYINPKIRFCVKWIKEILCLKVYNINTNRTIDTIKNDTSKKAVVHKQMMEMKSGGSAELTASEDKEYMLPFIGDFRQLIKDNESLFDESPEIKNLIEGFLNDYEETSDYPYVHVRWLNEKKSYAFTVKIVFKYYDMRYIQMHNMQSATRVTKERMEYAIEYLFENGSFIKGEEIR